MNYNKRDTKLRGQTLNCISLFVFLAYSATLQYKWYKHVVRLGPYLDEQLLSNSKRSYRLSYTKKKPIELRHLLRYFNILYFYIIVYKYFK